MLMLVAESGHQLRHTFNEAGLKILNRAFQEAYSTGSQHMTKKAVFAKIPWEVEEA